MYIMKSAHRTLNDILVIPPWQLHVPIVSHGSKNIFFGRSAIKKNQYIYIYTYSKYLL